MNQPVEIVDGACAVFTRAAILSVLGLFTLSPAGAQEVLEPVSSSPGHIHIEAVNVPVGKVAENLVRVAGIRIEGRERLGDTPITLHFLDIPVEVVVSLLADVAGLQSRRSADGTFRVGRPENQDAIDALMAEAARLREAKDDTALEKALTRILDLAPATQPRGMDALPAGEVDELTSLLVKRDDQAAAERVQRRWLAIVERNALPDAVAEAVLELGNFRIDQNDLPQARSLLERALQMAARDGVSASLATRARIGLAAVAVREGRADAADALQVQAFAGLKSAYDDDFMNLYRFHHNDSGLLIVAQEAGDHARIEKIIARRMDLYQQFPDVLSISDRLFDLSVLGYGRMALGRLPEARDAYTQLIGLAEHSAETAKAEYPDALHRRAVIDLALGRYREALDGWRQFCGLRHAIRGRDHPSTLAAFEVLAALGEMAATPTSLPRPVTCPAAQPAPVPDSVRYASMLDGDLFFDADMLLSEQLTVAQAASPSVPLAIANLLDRRAMIYAGRGPNYATPAERDFVEALRIRTASQGAAHDDTRLTARRLAGFYDLHGKPEQARDLRARWP
jgi:tetratricopeptide (TPR) repeat protein